MKNCILIVLSVLMLAVSACAGSTRSLTEDHMEARIRQARAEASYKKLEQARQTVALAREYFDQGGYEKCADLYINAADLYREIDAQKKERNTLINAAKMQARCSRTQAFLLTMARFKGLVGDLEMPSEEERFLINLSDHMNGRSLTYPVKGSWEVVFKN